MKTVPLGQIIRPARVLRAGRNNYPVLSMTMHDGLIDQAERFKKRIASSDLSSYRVALRGQLVVGFPIDEGVLDFQELHAAGIVSPAYGIWDLVDEDGVDRRYLKLALRSPKAFGYYRAKLRGSTARRRSLPTDVFLELPIPLPPRPEQRRIAAILDQADALRTKRRQVLDSLGALTQSIFHDMFGDLPSKRWRSVPFGQVAPKVENGTSPNCESRPAREDEWAVLKLGAITYGHFQPEENKAYLGDLGKMRANEVRSGDVLMTRKNTRELVGAVALVDDVRPQLLLPDLVFRLHLDPELVDRQYFQALMMNPQKRPAVRDLSSGSASSMPNISKSRLAELPIELPPLPLQKEFAARVEKVGESRVRAVSALAASDELFASLQSRAFDGRL